MIEVEGKIDNHPMYILIYYGVSHSYIELDLVEIFNLKRCKYEKSWLVQLDIGTKRRINELVKDCALNVNGASTKVVLNIILIFSYYFLIGMDWLDTHHVILECYNKDFT
jgi:hypothetical protein